MFSKYQIDMLHCISTVRGSLSETFTILHINNLTPMSLPFISLISNNLSNSTKLSGTNECWMLYVYNDNLPLLFEWMTEEENQDVVKCG